MNLHPDALPAHGYVLLDELPHADLVPFIQTYLRKRTPYTLLYYLSNLGLLGLVIYLLGRGYQLPGYHFPDRFAYFAYGLALAFGLLPLHEYLHVLAYRAQGARHTSYAANLRKFYFMALADRFVASQREFTVVALTPFLVLSTVLVGLLLLVPPAWQLTVAGTLLTHTAMCSGDFGLLSYLQFHRSRQVVTYDDVVRRTSYFYARSTEASPPTTSFA